MKYTNIALCFVLGAQDSSLKLWDLRKLKNFKTITLDNNYEVRIMILSHSLATGEFKFMQIIFLQEFRTS